MATLLLQPWTPVLDEGDRRRIIERSLQSGTGGSDTISRMKGALRILFGFFFVVAGVTHFTNQAFFTSIVPPYLPWPVALVVLSGLAEIGLGGALLVPRTS